MSDKMNFKTVLSNISKGKRIDSSKFLMMITDRKSVV